MARSLMALCYCDCGKHRTFRWFLVDRRSRRWQAKHARRHEALGEEQ